MEACKFVKEAFMHYKPIAGTNEGKTWIENEKMGNSLSPTYFVFELKSGMMIEKIRPGGRNKA
ncbi:hypothetical protein JT05_09445 [Desulfosporosinus sp. Tol-M]|nr:hypothetical protein JT05_09445 [Desulfosporosinus sp. Tol-M]